MITPSSCLSSSQPSFFFRVWRHHLFTLTETWYSAMSSRGQQQWLLKEPFLTLTHQLLYYYSLAFSLISTLNSFPHIPIPHYSIPYFSNLSTFSITITLFVSVLLSDLLLNHSTLFYSTKHLLSHALSLAFTLLIPLSPFPSTFTDLLVLFKVLPVLFDLIFLSLLL